MGYRKLTAIIRTTRLPDIEARLRELGVSGLSVTLVKGYGEYMNFFALDPKTMHARIELFAGSERAVELAQAIVEVAHTGGSGDGIVAVLPVEHVWRVRTKAEAAAHELA